MTRRYQCEVSRLAWQEAISLILDSKAKLAIALLTASGTLIGLGLLGSPDAVRDRAIEIASLLVVVSALVIPISMLYKLIAIPPRRMLEADTQVSLLKEAIAKLGDKKADQAALNRKLHIITLLYQNGQNLLNERVSLDMLEEYKLKLSKWQGGCLHFIRNNFSAQHAIRFNYIIYKSDDKFTYTLNSDHNDALLGLRARLDIIQSIIEENKSSWSVITKKQMAELDAEISAIMDKAERIHLGQRQSTSAGTPSHESDAARQISDSKA